MSGYCPICQVRRLDAGQTVCKRCGLRQENIRLRAEVEELKAILLEAPSTLDEAGMEGNNMALGALNIAKVHRSNVKRWLDKVQAVVPLTPPKDQPTSGKEEL